MTFATAITEMLFRTLSGFRHCESDLQSIDSRRFPSYCLCVGHGVSRLSCVSRHSIAGMESGPRCASWLFGSDAIPRGRARSSGDIERRSPALAGANRLRWTDLFGTLHGQPECQDLDVVFVSVRSPATGEPERVATEIEGRIQRAWKSWGQSFAFRTDWQLKVYRNGALIE